MKHRIAALLAGPLLIGLLLQLLLPMLSERAGLVVVNAAVAAAGAYAVGGCLRLARAHLPCSAHRVCSATSPICISALSPMPFPFRRAAVPAGRACGACAGLPRVARATPYPRCTSELSPRTNFDVDVRRRPGGDRHRVAKPNPSVTEGYGVGSPPCRGAWGDDARSPGDVPPAVDPAAGERLPSPAGVIAVCAGGLRI